MQTLDDRLASVFLVADDIDRASKNDGKAVRRLAGTEKDASLLKGDDLVVEQGERLRKRGVVLEEYA